MRNHCPIQIKKGHNGAFVGTMLEGAKGSMGNGPDCLRFDVIQDGTEANRISRYEVLCD